MATYDQPHLKDFAAVTRHAYGEGMGWYVGTIVEQTEFYDALIARVLQDAKIEPLAGLPTGVEAAVRRGEKGGLLFLINHTAEAKTAPAPAGRTNLLKNEPVDAKLTLEPFGVAVMEIP
jgi:beta-galactosidase